MKRNKGRILTVVSLLIITIMSLCLAMYAWARYTTQSSDTATADVAKWNFNLRLKEGKTGATETTEPIDLASTQFNHVANDRIAPGTSGLFYVIIDTTGTEVDCQYDVNIELTKCPRNIKFYRGSDDTGEILSAGGEDTTTRSFNFSKYLAVKKDVNGTITNENGKHEEPIYWKWEYQGEIDGSATTYDQWDTADSKLGTTTMAITATGTEMLEEPSSKVSLVSAITSTNYGDKVNYSVTANGKEVPNTWSIFHNDGEYVYIIYDSFLPVEYINIEKINENGMEIEAKSLYVISGKSTQYYHFMGDFADQLMNYLNWSDFVRNDLSKKGVTAAGAPTIQIWKDSWHATGNAEIYIAKTTPIKRNDGYNLETSDYEGYYVGSTTNPNNPESYSVVGLNNTNNLYFPYEEEFDNSCYYLASVSAKEAMLFVGRTGCIGYGAPSASRPVVKLPATVLGEYKDGGWNIE